MIQIVSVAALLLAAGAAHAVTTGRIAGFVHGEDGEGVPGVRVTARSPSLPGERAAVTGADGAFHIELLPGGSYSVSASREGFRGASRTGIQLAAGQTARVDLTLLAELAAGPEVVVTARAPTLDAGSAAGGGTLTPELAAELPNFRLLTYALQFVPGATRAAGEQASFAGSGAGENIWVIDGVYAGSVLMGAGSAAAIWLPTRDVEEVSVTTGGLSAEAARAGGAAIGVITKGGGNEFHASMEMGWTSLALQAGAQAVAAGNEALATKVELARTHTPALDVSGYLVRDRVWFRAALSAPRRVKRWSRIVRRAVSFEDVDGNGSYGALTDRLAFRDEHVSSVDSSNNLLQPSIKISARVTERFSVEAVHHATYNRIEGNADVLGADTRAELRCLLGESVYDGSVTKLGAAYETGGGALLVEAFAALATDRQEAHAWPNAQGRRILSLAAEAGNGIPLSRFEPAFADDPATPFPEFPVYQFSRGGFGAEVRRFGRRIQLSASVTAFPSLFGAHRLRAGVERLDERFDERLGYAGGALDLELHSVKDKTDLYVTIERYRTGADPRTDRAALLSPWVDSSSRTETLALHAQDFWTLHPSLAVSVGARFEQARLVGSGGAPALEPSPSLGPRAALLFDWTRRGASKAYLSASRTHQALPLAVNRNTFVDDFESLYVGGAGNPADPAEPYTLQGGRAQIAGGQIALVPAPVPCGASVCPPYRTQVAGSAPVRSAAVDEISAGYEQEIEPLSLLVGLRATRRTLVRAVDNVFLDGSTAVVGNVGEGALSRGYVLDRSGYATPDPSGVFPTIAVPRPRRLYEALTVSARRRLASGWQADASYTLSSLTGNYAGPDAGDASRGPLTVAYDVPELMVNREGPLPDDARHAVTFFAAHTRAAGPGTARAGVGVLARSGAPLDVTGPHFLLGYGDRSVYLLPRGAGGRLPWTASLDVQLSYELPLRGVRAELVLDVFNVFNSQAATAADDRYVTRATLSNPYLFEFYGVRPVVADAETASALSTQARPGATFSDLAAHPEWVTVVTPYGDRPLAASEVNPHFGRVTKRQEPRFAALTLRLSL